MACVNICPVEAITMTEDACRFLYPDINQDKCIKCNKCKNVCENRIVIKEGNTALLKTYACWSMKEETRYKSTSGGAFSEVIEPFISNGGIVVAAEYSKDNLVYHTIIDNIEDIAKNRQSKYIQSNIGNVYAEIRKAKKMELRFYFAKPLSSCRIEFYYW